MSINEVIELMRIFVITIIVLTIVLTFAILGGREADEKEVYLYTIECPNKVYTDVKQIDEIFYYQNKEFSFDYRNCQLLKETK